MHKRIVLAALLACAFAVTANAQVIPWEDIHIAFGAGAGVPLRNEDFAANNQTAFYKVMTAEFDVFESASGGGVGLYGLYDGAIFGSNPGTEGGGVDVTTWGLGAKLWAALNATQSVRLGAKLGATSNTIVGEEMEWVGQSGLFLDVDASKGAAIRFACDVRTLSQSMQIESVFPHLCVVLTPKAN